MKAEDVFSPLRKVRNAVASASSKLGFDLMLFGGVPDHMGSDHRVQLIFRIDEDRVGKEPPNEDDKTFDEMMAAEREREKQERQDEERDQARDDLLDVLKDSGPKKGFLE